MHARQALRTTRVAGATLLHGDAYSPSDVTATAGRQMTADTSSPAQERVWVPAAAAATGRVAAATAHATAHATTATVVHVGFGGGGDAGGGGGVGSGGGGAAAAAGANPPAPRAPRRQLVWHPQQQQRGEVMARAHKLNERSAQVHATARAARAEAARSEVAGAVAHRRSQIQTLRETMLARQQALRQATASRAGQRDPRGNPAPTSDGSSDSAGSDERTAQRARAALWRRERQAARRAAIPDRRARAEARARDAARIAERSRAVHAHHTALFGERVRLEDGGDVLEEIFGAEGMVAPAAAPDSGAAVTHNDANPADTGDNGDDGSCAAATPPTGAPPVVVASTVDARHGSWVASVTSMITRIDAAASSDEAVALFLAMLDHVTAASSPVHPPAAGDRVLPQCACGVRAALLQASIDKRAKQPQLWTVAVARAFREVLVRLQALCAIVAQ